MRFNNNHTALIFGYFHQGKEQIFHFKIRFPPFCIAKKGGAKNASPWKFDYPLTNDAKISKLATLRQLKFLRLLIVAGPSLHFLRDKIDFEFTFAKNRSVIFIHIS